MNTNKCDRWQVTGDMDRQQARNEFASSRHVSGFTLVELLVVISIIGVLAGFTFVVLAGAKKKQYISHTQAELAQLAAAIDSYHDAYGFYPPDNPGNGSPLANQLYYELVGTTSSNLNVTTIQFQTLDGSATITSDQLKTAFGVDASGNPYVGGFINCSKYGSNEESRPARNFLHELRPNQISTFVQNGVSVTNLVGSVGGVDVTYQPMGVSGLNPWRYRSSGTLTNNPGAYELWIQVQISGRKYLICNWTKTVQINSPLP